MLTIDAVSMAIGFATGLFFYIVVAVIAALIVARDQEEKENKNRDIYLKKLKESGYEDNIFE